MDTRNQGLRIRIRQSASVKEKTLIKLVAETLKKLVHLYQVKTAEEILSCFEIQALRYKLKECLSRLIFLEPLEFGQKAEDTIWKSIFYEPIRIFKRELKNQPNLLSSKSVLLVAFQRHILGAIGYYQKLILRLQTEFGLSKEICPDFQGFLPCDEKETKEISPELKSWAFSCIQHSLLYIGDLYRYEHDIKCTNSRVLATRYYNQVLSLNPSLGHAYNQLATLDTLSYYGLNAAYFYLKAQLCSHSFGQAKENLFILFERNVKRLRSVLDRESLMKKSGSNVNKNGVKVIRVKSCIIKYLNVWRSFTASADMNNYEMKQLAVMCDDVLNIFSFVLGFDRKLVVNTPGTDTGVRPSTLNVRVVSQILFIASACLDSMVSKNEPDSDPEQLRYASMKLDLAHSFVLNLYGHVFNQCLVRVRDELRTANIDVSMLLFRRYEAHDQSSVATNSCDDVCSTQSVTKSLPDQSVPRTKKKRMALSKRLVRARLDTDDTNNEEDLSEDDQNLSENENLLWDDHMSYSSDSDDDKRGGFDFSDGEDETEFESEEEIHSQDEDDQIIRAIVGQNTVFGRNQTSSSRDQKRAQDRDTSKKIIFGDSLMENSDECHDDQQAIKSPKRRSNVSQNTINTSLHVKPSPEALVTCVYNVDLLQSLSVSLQSLQLMSGDMLDSFHRVWCSSPFLWKHFAVLFNFCENVLDDLNQNDTSVIRCVHSTEDVRSMLPCVLPEDGELNISDIVAPTDVEPIRCSNKFHQVITRLTKILQCALWLEALPQGPITLQRSNASNLWLFSYSHNSPRTNLVSKSWMHITSSANGGQSHVAANIDKEKLMRKMARLRLKNEVLSDHDLSDENEGTEELANTHKSRSPSCDAFRSVYLIPDVEYLCGRLDSIKMLVRSQRYICVIPQAVIQRLDRLKSHDHGARQAIKYLEAEMQLNNEHIKIESSVTLRLQDMVCDSILDWPAIETIAIRLVDESITKSGPGNDIVVTVLTASASNLSDQFSDHYAKKRIDFQSTIEF